MESVLTNRVNEGQKKVFILEGLRSPFVKAGKEFANIHPNLLAAHNIRELLYKLEFQGKEIEEVILGNGFTLPDATNIARIAALKAGLPKSLSATTISRNCASSIESLATGLAKIQAGFYHSALVGGVESMSQAPFLLKKELAQSIQSLLLSKTLKRKIKSLRSTSFKIK